MAILSPPNRLLAPELLIPGRKPQSTAVIDWSNPLTANLEAAYLLWDNRDSTGKHHAVNTAVEFQPKGGHFNSGASTDLDLGDSWFAPDRDASVFAIATPDVATSSDLIVSARPAGGTRWYVGTSSGSSYVRVGNSAEATMSSVAQHETFSIAACQSGTSLLGYHNGLYGNTATDSVSGTIDTMMIGNYADGPSSGSSFEGHIHCVFIWMHRTLSANEVRSLHEDPYQFFMAPNAYSWPLAGGGTSILPQIMHHRQQQE